MNIPSAHFFFTVVQVLEVYVNDSHLTGRPKVGKATLPLANIPRDGKLTMSVPLEPVNPGQKPQGEVLLDISFKVFEDDEQVWVGVGWVGGACVSVGVGVRG
jgi:hypothetical protein